MFFIALVLCILRTFNVNVLILLFVYTLIYIFFRYSVPGESPQALTAYNTSVSSIHASWKEIVADKQHGIMQGYKLFFYEVTWEGGLKSLENHTYELAVHETTFTGLKIYTKYRTEVQGFNNYGDGPVAAVEVFTEEGSK